MYSRTFHHFLLQGVLSPSTSAGPRCLLVLEMHTRIRVDSISSILKPFRLLCSLDRGSMYSISIFFCHFSYNLEFTVRIIQSPNVSVAYKQIHSSICSEENLDLNTPQKVYAIRIQASCGVISLSGE